MRTLFALSLSLLSLSSLAQTTHFSITGTTPPDRHRVYVMDPNHNWGNIVTAPVENGKFSAEGDAEANAILLTRWDGARQALPFINDGTPLVIDLENYKVIEGSKQNMVFHHYNDLSGELELNIRRLSARLSSLREKSESRETFMSDNKALIDSLNMLVAEKNKVVKEAVENNLDNHIAYIFLPDYFYLPDVAPDMLRKAVSEERPYGNLARTKDFRKILDLSEKTAPLIGKKFVDVACLKSDNTKASLSDFCGKGSYVLIDIWASWNGPSRRTMPDIAMTLDRFKDKGLTIVSVSVDTDKDAWLKAVDELKMSWVNLIDPTGSLQSDIASIYTAGSVPVSVLVSPDGTVLKVGMRPTVIGALPHILGY